MVILMQPLLINLPLKFHLLQPKTPNPIKTPRQNFRMEFPQVKNNSNNNNNDQLRAQSLLWNHIFNHIDSMSLKCAVELGIPQTIYNYGNRISLPNLLSSLSISFSKQPHVRRLMRQLGHSGIFKIEQQNNEIFYSLTPISSLLVETNKDASLSKFLIAALHPVIMDPFRSMSSWFKSKEGDDTQFRRVNGCGFWEFTGRDPDLNKVFNEGMESDSKFLIGALIEECGDKVFGGVKKLVDVGGGTGSTTQAMSTAYPEMKCSVLDLPQVVNGLDGGGGVEFIAGDMFEYIPPCDAILLKWILHDWNDEECVKILKRCKEAITSSKQEGGKVIIVDQVLESETSNNEKSTQAQFYLDMVMLIIFDGMERDEQEWFKIFTEAGFRSYKIIPALGLRSVIEIYP